MRIKTFKTILDSYNINYEELDTYKFKINNKTIDVLIFDNGHGFLLTHVKPNNGEKNKAEYMLSESDYTFLMGKYGNVNVLIGLPTKQFQKYLETLPDIEEITSSFMTYYKEYKIADIIIDVYNFKDDYCGYLTFETNPFETNIITGFKFLKEVESMAKPKNENVELVQSQPKHDLSKLPKEKVELLKRTVAKGITDDEFQIFLALAQKYDLDPFARQIWCVKYDKNEPASIFTGRDGFLHLAHMSGKFDGMETKVRKENEPLIIKDRYGKISLNSDFQYVATCTVYRKDMNHPITVEVWEEEYNTGNRFWRTKRRTMIQKVAESQALRRAFDISGLYAPEEFGFAEAKLADDVEIEEEQQIAKEKSDEVLEKLKKITGEDISTEEPQNEDNVEEIKGILEEEETVEEAPDYFGDEVVNNNLATEAQIKKLFALLHKITKINGKDKDKVIENIKKKFKVEHLKEISKTDMSNLIDYFEKMLSKLEAGGQ